MSADSSSNDDHNSRYITATTEEESSGSSIFADSFRSLDLPPGYLINIKSSSILASPRTRSARQYTTTNSVDEYEPSSISCRFYDDFSFVDSSDCETGSETHLLVDRSRQQVRHLPAGPSKLKLPPARQSSGVRSLTPSRRRRSSPFHRRSLWNDDFDPFMAALKTVRDGEGKDRAAAAGVRSHRRASSDSVRHIGPRPSVTKDLNDLDAIKAERSLRWLKSMPRARARSPSPGAGPGTGLVPVPSPSGPMPSPQPKGVMYARHTRMVKMDRREDEEAMMMDAASCRCGSGKREIIKHLMVSMKGRTAAEEEAAAEEKRKKEEEEKRQPKVSRRKRLMRKLSFNKSRNGDEEDGGDEKKRGSEMGRKMAPSKGGLLGCVGIKNKIYAGC